MSVALSIGTECSTRSQPFGGFSARYSVKTTAAAMPCRESSRGQRSYGLLAEYRQLLQCAKSDSHKGSVHVGNANCGGVTSQHSQPVEVEGSVRVHLRWLDCFDAGHAAESSDLPRSRPSKSQGWAFHWPGSVCCYRSLLALATTWPSLLIAAKAPVK